VWKWTSKSNWLRPALIQSTDKIQMTCIISTEITAKHCFSETSPCVHVNQFKLELIPAELCSNIITTLHRCCQNSISLHAFSATSKNEVWMTYSASTRKLGLRYYHSCEKEQTREMRFNLVLLAGKMVVVWISFPTEHCKCLPHWRFQRCLLVTTV